jgi:carbonyl reductase 1
MAKVAVVTGANQGLGLALVRGLCRRLGADGTVYLTARDRGRRGAGRRWPGG